MNWDDLDPVRVLDEGAHGVLVEARHVTTKQLYAVKVGKYSISHPGVLKHALREIRVLRSLQPHPHIVYLSEAFQSVEQGTFHLCFELCQGSLHQELRRLPGGVLPAPSLKAVAWQLLRALAHCHAHGVIHRDVKPANVLVARHVSARGAPEAGALGTAKASVAVVAEASASSTPFPLVKLCDFGSARYVRCHTDPWRKEPYSPYVVTRFYRSPELLRGDAYGPAVDVWSYGCTVAELANGRPLFPGRSSMDQLWQILRCLDPLPPDGGTVPKASAPACAALSPQQAALQGQTWLNGACSRGLGDAGGNEGSDGLSSGAGRTRLTRLLRGVCDPALVDLIAACLTLNPARRPTVRQLLAMPYFADVATLLAGTELEGLLSHSHHQHQPQQQQQRARPQLAPPQRAPQPPPPVALALRPSQAPQRDSNSNSTAAGELTAATVATVLSRARAADAAAAATGAREHHLRGDRGVPVPMPMPPTPLQAVRSMPRDTTSPCVHVAPGAQGGKAGGSRHSAATVPCAQGATVAAAGVATVAAAGVATAAAAGVAAAAGTEPLGLHRLESSAPRTNRCCPLGAEHAAWDAVADDNTAAGTYARNDADSDANKDDSATDADADNDDDRDGGDGNTAAPMRPVGEEVPTTCPTERPGHLAPLPPSLRPLQGGNGGRDRGHGSTAAAVTAVTPVAAVAAATSPAVSSCLTPGSAGANTWLTSDEDGPSSVLSGGLHLQYSGLANGGAPPALVTVAGSTAAAAAAASTRPSRATGRFDTTNAAGVANVYPSVGKGAAGAAVGAKLLMIAPGLQPSSSRRKWRLAPASTASSRSPMKAVLEQPPLRVDNTAAAAAAVAGKGSPGCSRGPETAVATNNTTRPTRQARSWRQKLAARVLAALCVPRLAPDPPSVPAITAAAPGDLLQASGGQFACHAPRRG